MGHSSYHWVLLFCASQFACSGKIAVDERNSGAGGSAAAGSGGSASGGASGGTVDSGLGGAGGPGGGGQGGAMIDAGIDARVDADLCPVAEGESVTMAMNIQELHRELIDEDGFVVDNGIDESGMRLVAFGLTTTAQQFRVTLPGNFELPVYVDQRVHLYATEFQPWWIEKVLVIWNDQKIPLFAFFDGAHPSTVGWVTPSGGRVCPTATQLVTECPPLDATCGSTLIPPVGLLAHGGVSSVELPTVLYPGQSTDGFANYHYTVFRSHEVVAMQCFDYPSYWIQAMVSQLSCRPDKIDFTQDNVEQYDLFGVCHTGGVDAKLQEIDPSLMCNVGSGFACQDGEVACGGMLDDTPAGRSISNRVWSKLCAMSAIDSVASIRGAYFE